MALSPETGILVRDGREERYRAEARRRWRQRRERRGPEPRGPWAPWETEAAGGALLGLLREPSPAPSFTSDGALGPERKENTLLLLQPFYPRVQDRAQNSGISVLAGICCKEP